MTQHETEDGPPISTATYSTTPKPTMVSSALVPRFTTSSLEVRATDVGNWIYQQEK